MEFSKSKTYQNLQAAFAGESQARNKYTYFASKARKEGYNKIASIFEETAGNEKEHAKIWFKLLNSGISSTEENLKAAADGEAYETEIMYVQFAKDAKAEGYEDVAALFEEVGKIEKSHKERYERLLEQVKNGTVFSKEKPTIWICSNCGYSQTSTEAPDECPVCSHSKAYFYCE